jgi:hypothetical protein
MGFADVAFFTLAPLPGFLLPSDASSCLSKLSSTSSDFILA